MSSIWNDLFFISADVQKTMTFKTVVIGVLVLGLLVRGDGKKKMKHSQKYDTFLSV